MPQPGPMLSCPPPFLAGHQRLSTIILNRFLSGYVLALEVMTIRSGFSSWKSVQSCSVETQESTTQPDELAETIIMTQVRLCSIMRAS